MFPTRSNASELKKTIDNFLEYLEIERGSSPLTIRNYRHYLMRLHDWLVKSGGAGSVDEITEEAVRRYRLYLSRLRNERGDALSRKTQGYYIIALRSFLRFLVRHDREVSLSAEKLELPKIEDRQVKFLSGADMDRLLNAPSLSTLGGKRDKAILETFFSTGLRISELVSLDRDKINFDKRELGVVGKGGRARVVFLSARAAEWLELYLKARTDGFKALFIRHSGRVEPSMDDSQMRLSPRSIQRMVKKYVRKVGLSIEATPHVIRHSFATDLLTAGADLRSVQEMLGHKNVATTQIYTHVTNKQLRDVHRAFHSKGTKD